MEIVQKKRGGSISTAIYFAALLGALWLVALAGGKAQAGAPTRPSAAPANPNTYGWRVVPPVTSANLHDVFMVSGADGWTVGEIPLSGMTQTQESRILRYNGSTWHETPFLHTDERLQDVYMISANDGYIAAWGSGDSNIYHWNGADWTVAYHAPRIVNKISATSSNNVWASGTGYIYHYDGVQWSIQYTSPGGDNIFSIWMVSPTEGWATGTLGLILHYQNDLWTQYTPSPAPAVLYDVFFTGPNDGWATGYTENTYVIHYNGVQWTRDYTPTTQIDRLYMLSPTEGWGTSYSQISHFQNGVWSEYPNPSGEGLSGLYMVSSTDGWIVGTNGAMLHYSDDGTPGPTSTQAASTATNAPSLTPTGQPPSSTRTPVANPSATTQPANTATLPPAITNTPQPTATPIPPATTPTSTPCAIQFADVAPNSPFYSFVRCLVCRGVMSGYACGGVGEPCDGLNSPYFRPQNNISRGQIAKIVSNAAGFVDDAGPQIFQDVPPTGPGSTFYVWINRLVRLNIMSGYACGGAGEPCGPGSLPYFRPNADASRGQLSKIVANAAFFTEPHTEQAFQDAPPTGPGSTFYIYIQRLSSRGYIGGYPCGGAGEPCGPGSLPYFRPNSPVTRGQASKIVANTFFPGCQTPARR